ncbi:MAG TPA: hypothetical protein VN578_16695 [Candidatus Binatia bacterium]|jgi:hypothetical protein|nr:hypothetical protein [Candidatus Binatia bacterium]
MLGKIASLPAPIQEQINQRLQNAETANTLLPWLNSLPETKALLKSQFDGAPINKQNLSDHRNHGFRDWLDRQEAIAFASSLNDGDAELQKILPADVPEKLSRWVFFRLATAARALSSSDSGSDKSLRHLGHLAMFLLALRRGELSAGRLTLEQQRLALDLSSTAQAKEKEFWEWTRRPEIQGKLYPYRNPDEERRKVVRLIDREMLGIIHSPDDPRHETEDPGMLI